MSEAESDVKATARRARKGSGCVHRPKFKGKDGRERFGEWRIKFTWKDDSGVKHVHDERVQGQEVNKSIAQELLKTRMAEAKSRTLLTGYEDLTYENLRSGLINNYEEKGRKSLLTSKDGRRYISSLNHLDNYFSGRKAIEIRVPQITTFKKARMAFGVGNASVNRSLGLLRRMFSLAVRNDKFPKDRVPIFELLKEPEPRIGFLKQEGFAKLRHELPENLRPV